jgi:hypothetical protein
LFPSLPPLDIYTYRVITPYACIPTCPVSTTDRLGGGSNALFTVFLSNCYNRALIAL